MIFVALIFSHVSHNVTTLQPNREKSAPGNEIRDAEAQLSVMKVSMVTCYFIIHSFQFITGTGRRL